MGRPWMLLLAPGLSCVLPRSVAIELRGACRRALVCCRVVVAMRCVRDMMQSSRCEGEELGRQ
jgi:hypothetical protein